MNHTTNKATAERGGWLKTASNRLRGLWGGKDQADAPSPQNGLSPQAASIFAILRPEARQRWLMPSLGYITPDYVEDVLAGTLRGDTPEAEHALYELMMQTWPRLVKNISEIKNNVLGLQWILQCAEDDEGDDLAARMHLLLERARDGMRGDYRIDGQGWRGTLAGLLDGYFCGVCVREIDWEVRTIRDKSGAYTQATLPRQTRRTAARHYGWDQQGIFGLRLPGSDILGDIPRHKFLVGVNNAGFGHPSGGALLRCLAWWWCAGNFSADWLLHFAELYGVPFRWATYDPSQPGLKEALEEMLENVGSAGWGAAPNGTQLNINDTSQAGKDNPQGALMDRVDMICDLLILGQRLTSTEGDSGSRALGEVHQSIRADVIDAAALWLCEVLNEQLVPSVCTLNLGDGVDTARLPWYQAAPKKVKDVSARIDDLCKLMDRRLPIIKSTLYEEAGLPEPTDEDDVFMADTSPQGAAAPQSGAADWLRGMLARMPAETRRVVLASLDAQADSLPAPARKCYVAARGGRP